MAIIDQLVARAPLGTAGRLLHDSHVAVVAYHGVPDPQAFDRQLATIAGHHTFIGPGDLRGWLDGASLPKHPVLVTFDDGERSVYDHAGPVLAERSVQALLFVVAGLVDTDTAFWWDEVESLADIEEVRRLKRVPNGERLATIERLRAGGAAAAAGRQLTTAQLHELSDIGVEIGNHSYDHPCLDQCDEAEATGQIERAHAALTEMMGTPPTAFAYPNGNLDVRIEPTLRTLGYDLGFLFDHRHTNRNGDRLRLSRLRLDASASPERALGILSGVHGAIMRLRRRG